MELHQLVWRRMDPSYPWWPSRLLNFSMLKENSADIEFFPFHRYDSGEPLAIQMDYGVSTTKLKAAASLNRQFNTHAHFVSSKSMQTFEEGCRKHGKPTKKWLKDGFPSLILAAKSSHEMASPSTTVARHNDYTDLWHYTHKLVMQQL